MRRFVSLSVTAAIVGVALAATPASAAVSGVTNRWFFGEDNLTSDNNAEWLWNSPLYPQTVGPFGSTILDVGDVLFAIAEFETNEDLTGGGGTNRYDFGTDPDAFTAVAAVQLKSISDADGDGIPELTFGPVGALTRAALFAAGPAIGLGPVAATVAGWAPGTIVESFENSAMTAFNRTGTDDTPTNPAAGPPPPPHTDIGIGPFVEESLDWLASSDGLTIWELGFTGPSAGTGPNPLDVAPTPAAGEGWLIETSALDVATLSLIVSEAGEFNAGLNETVSHLPIVYADVDTAFGEAQFAFNGSIRGVRNILTPHDAFSNVDITFHPIPEPLSVLVWALLIGAAAAPRRRTR
jgi:hypothetical protein